MAQRIDIDGRDLYKPNPSQARFHRAVRKAKYVAAVGGVRSGKSVAGVEEVIDAAYTQPGNRILVTRKYDTDIKDSIQATFFEMCPPELIKGTHSDKGGFKIYLSTTNPNAVSEIIFKGLYTTLGRVSKLNSYNLGMFVIEEASEVGVTDFEFLMSRLSLTRVQNHRGLLLTNPTTDDHWIAERFEKNKTPDFELVRFDTEDNREHLPPGYIEDLLKHYDAMWVDRFLRGNNGVSLKGIPIWHGFSFKDNVKSLQYNKELTLYRGWDFGYVHPAVVVAQIDEQSKWHVLSEFFGSREYLKDFAPTVLADCEERFGKDARWKDFCDHAGTQKSGNSDKTSVEILSEFGVDAESAPTGDVTRRLEITQSLIDENRLDLDVSVKRLKDAIFGGYVRDEGKNESKKDGYFEHIADAWGYIVQNYYKDDYFWGKMPVNTGKQFVYAGRHRGY